MSSNKTPLVTNIQRFSTNDGPGIRTTIFLKGCNLNCPWCHNPENRSPYQDFFYNKEKCVRCGQCAEVCPVGAITPPGPEGEYPKRDREKCDKCMKCVESCPAGALTKVGVRKTKDEIMKEVKSDQVFYKNSGGGMTLSGGELLMFPEFALELLQEAKTNSIHTCIDTQASAKWEVLEGLLNYVDIVLIDIKHMDSELHKKVVGIPNDTILENIRKMAEKGTETRIRIPLIPGFNDTEENIEKTAEFGKELGTCVSGVDVLPYHNWAEKKYEQLDLEYQLKDVPAMTKEEAETFVEIFKNHGFTDVTIGG